MLAGKAGVLTFTPHIVSWPSGKAFIWCRGDLRILLAFTASDFRVGTLMAATNCQTNHYINLMHFVSKHPWEGGGGGRYIYVCSIMHFCFVCFGFFDSLFVCSFVCSFL